MTTTTTTSKPAFQDADSWSRHAADYGMPDGIKVAEFIRSILSALEAGRPFEGPETVFLDDGCGTGVLTARLVQLYGSKLSASAKLMATDFSSGMIEQLEKRKADESNPLWKRVDARVEDAMDLSSIPDNSVTHIGSSMCIFMVPDPARAIAEAYRVLAPGGVFAWSSFTKTPFEEAFNAARDIRPDGKAPVYPIPANMKTEEGVTAAMAKAGFVQTKVTLGTMALPMPEDKKAFWDGMMKSTNPGFVNLFEGWSEEERGKAVEKILKSLEGKREDVLNGETMVIAGVKPRL